MARILGQIGLVCVVFGLATGWFVNWSREVVAIPILNIAIGIAFLTIWLINVGLPLFRGEGRVAAVKSAKVVTFSSVYLGLVVAVVGGLNFIISNYDWRYDLTRERVYTLSERTIEIVKKLEYPLDLVVPETDTTRGAISDLRDLVKQLRKHTDKVNLIVFNPYAKQTLVKDYNLQRGDVGVAVLRKGGDSKLMQKLDSLTEADIATAILKLISNRRGKVGYITGHGEPELEGVSPESLESLISDLKRDGIDVVPVSIASAKEIPSDVGALMLIGPKKALSEDSIKLLQDYIKSGGRMIIASDFFGDQKSIAKILDTIGFELGNDIVIDPVQRVGGPADIALNDYGMHRVTRSLNANRIVVGSNFSSVWPRKPVRFGDDDPEVIGEAIVRSSRASWAEKGLANRRSGEAVEVAFDEGVDIRGPIPVVSVFSKYLEGGKKETRVVVFGSSTIFNSVYYPLYFNSDLVMNSINWLLDFEDFEGVRPKGLTKSLNPIPNQTLQKYFMLLLLLPQLIFIIGLIIAWRRSQA